MPCKECRIDRFGPPAGPAAASALALAVAPTAALAEPVVAGLTWTQALAQAKATVTTVRARAYD